MGKSRFPVLTQPKPMKPLKYLLVILATLTAAANLAFLPSANAITYDVSRTFGGGTATQVGNVDVALGSYTIMNGGPSPFTYVNLTLTLNGTAYSLDHADTSLIFGADQFLIDATASSLNFGTANGDSANPADLQFFDLSNTSRYVIGSDGLPNFEAAYSPTEGMLSSVSLPLVFGTVTFPVPDAGSTLAMLGISLFGLGLVLRRGQDLQD